MPKPSIFVKAAGAAAVALVFFTAYEALTSVFLPHIAAWNRHFLSILMGAAIAFTATVAVLWRLETEHNLVEREKANFAAVIENLPGLTVIVDTNNKFVRWNSRFRQVLGYSDAELAQMWAQTTIAEDYRELVPQVMGRAWSQGHAEMEAAWITKSGERIPCYLTGVRIVEGNQTLILSVGIDISEQKRAEDKLRKSEEQYRRLLGNLPDVTWTSDINGHTTYISANVEQVFGYTAEEMIERGEELWLGRIHPDDADQVASSYHSLYEDGGVFDAEYRIRHKDERWMWVHDRAIRTHEQDGVRYADGVFSDITERKEAEKTDSQLAALVSCSSDAFIGKSADGVIRSWNPAAQKMFGYTAAEAIGQHVSMLVAPEHLHEVPPVLSRISRGEQVPRFDSVGVRKNGSRVDLSLAVFPVVDKNGTVLGISTIATDISMRKQAENELLRAKEAAEAAARAKSEFLANISHELRTPMNGILGMTDLALDTSLDTEQREYLLTIKTSGRALLELIEKLLDFTHTESGALTLSAAAFDLPEMLRQTMRPFIFQGEQVGLQVVYEIKPDVPTMVVGDAERLRQVLVNLIGNAVKFTHQGEIAVRVSCKSGTGDSTELLFAVSDTGIGVPKDKYAVIFEPFMQSDGSSTRKYGGTGLGLAVCARLVELMGGKIWVESEPGRGSTFYFTAQMGSAPQPDVPSLPRYSLKSGMI